MRNAIRIVVLVQALAAAPCLADQVPTDLANASLEDLMKVEITSASRKEQRVEDTPAAVYVLTHDDIHRSGMNTLPDVLRLVPGVQVAQVNRSKWAVSVRGFNSVFSNKLLVLIDGRSVYNRLYSGVLWDFDDVPLEDIERIEVIRGPAAAVWGANAVNGVINIITMAASKTAGPEVRVGAGSASTGDAFMQYGASGGGIDYRLTTRWRTAGSTELPDGAAAGDSYERVSASGRVDWTSGRDTIFVRGQAAKGRTDSLWLSPTPILNPDPSDVIRGASTMSGGSITARWERALPRGSRFELQSSADVVSRSEPIVDYSRRQGDVDWQFQAPAIDRHNLLVGGGARFVHESFYGTNDFSMNPPVGKAWVVNLFAEDTIAVWSKRLAFTLGARLEHDSYAGLNPEPSARAMWKVTARQRVWVAVSHAERTPSMQDRGLQMQYGAEQMAGSPLPVITIVNGNPALGSERILSVDGGYRFSGERFQVDVSAFSARYNELRSEEPGTPGFTLTPAGPAIVVPVTFQNLFNARTYGAEVSARYQLASAWRLEAAYTGFDLVPHPDAASHDVDNANYDGSAPSAEWQVRSVWSINPRTDLDLFLLRTGELAQWQVPARTRLDVRFERRLKGGVSLGVVGQNLAGAHSEFASPDVQMLATRLPRSVFVSVGWRVR